MSTTTTIVEDAMRRSIGPGDRSSERPAAPSPGSAELPYTRNRIRRMTPLPADLQQARRFARASVDSRTMERNCVLPAVSDTAALRAFKILRTRVLRRLEMNKWNSIAVSGIKTMAQYLDDSLAAPRLHAALVSAFASLALVMATIGLYGLIAYVVSQRTAEIGIRMALGAERRDVFRGVFTEGARLTLAGLTIGVIFALSMGRVVSTLLFGVTAGDHRG